MLHSDVGWEDSQKLKLIPNLFFWGKLPTYPFLKKKPTITLAIHLGQNFGLGEG